MKSLLLTCGLLAVCPLFSGEVDMDDYQSTFLLPLDVTEIPNYTLSVTIPRGFQPLQTLEEFSSPDQVTIEYIPKGQSADNWSEIITVNKFIGKEVQAKQFTEYLAQQILANSEDWKILSKSSSKKETLEQSSFMIQYMHENRQEVIGARYFSGPYDSGGLQYTIRVNKKEELKDAISKIREFFDNNTQVIQSNGDSQ